MEQSRESCEETFVCINTYRLHIGHRGLVKGYGNLGEKGTQDVGEAFPSTFCVETIVTQACLEVCRTKYILEL